MKIHIMGPSGSGKSTCAAALSREYGIGRHDLDDLFWRNESGEYASRRGKEERRAMLEAILAEESWITEGVYHSWVQDLLAAADIVFFLEVPRPVRVKRIVARFFARKREAANAETLKSLLDLLAWDRGHTRELREVRRGLEAAGRRLRVVGGRDELLAAVAASRAPSCGERA